MKIIIDGDSCPVLDDCRELCQLYEVELDIYCDTSHWIEGAKVVAKGKDAVDFKILNEAKKDDLVITSDYGLACMLLGKGVRVLHSQGYLYTSNNIDGLLYSRYINMKSKRKKGPKKRSEQDSIRFREALRKEIIK